MNTAVLSMNTLESYKHYLAMDEKSHATIEKYMRDVRRFWQFLGDERVSKETVISFKKSLISEGLAVRSINSMLASINSLLSFLGLDSCKVRNLRTQHKAYCDVNQELTREEYYRLIKAAKYNPRMEMILQTIGGTGIRISELTYFTVEAVRHGEISVSCKNKTRTILLTGKLRRVLLHYAKKNGIKSGIIFRTKNGKPLHRSNIWREMKRLCEKAQVVMSKVFPHNLRKLFAKCFYNVEKDIAKLADVLGHSSINTTRIYIMTSGGEHRKQIESLGLVVSDVDDGWEERKKEQHNSHYVVS